MKALRKILKAFLIIIKGLWVIVITGVIFFVIMLIATPHGLSAQQVAALITVRDACGAPMEHAYWLMLDHVPEPDGMESYHDKWESEWESEAYALMREAGRLAQIAVGRTELEDASFNFFHPGGESEQWYMLLTLPFDRMHLIYYPFDIGSTDPWTPIEGHPHWFYDTGAY